MLGAKVTGPSSPLLPLLPLKNKTGILLGVVAALIRMRDTHMCMHTHATHTHSLPLSFIPVCIPPPFSETGCKETLQRVCLSAQPYLVKNDCSLLLVTMLR